MLLSIVEVGGGLIGISSSVQFFCGTYELLIKIPRIPDYGKIIFVCIMSTVWRRGMSQLNKIYFLAKSYVPTLIFQALSTSRLFNVIPIMIYSLFIKS